MQCSALHASPHCCGSVLSPIHSSRRTRSDAMLHWQEIVQLLLHSKAARCLVAGSCPPSGWKRNAPTLPSCALCGGVKDAGPLQYITLGCKLDTADLY